LFVRKETNMQMPNSMRAARSHRDVNHRFADSLACDLAGVNPARFSANPSRHE